MSKQVIQRNINDALAKEITRGTVEGAKGGHLLILGSKSVKAFFDAFYELSNESIDVMFLSQVCVSAVAGEGFRRARELQDYFKKTNKRRFTVAINHLASSPLGKRYIRGGTFIEEAFLLTGFSSANVVKTHIADAIVEKLKPLKGFFQDSLEVTKSKALASIDRGHGVGGFAVSEIKIAQKMNLLNELASRKVPMSEVLKNFPIKTEEYEISAEDKLVLDYIATTYDQIITRKGTLRANYISVLAFQGAEENRKLDKNDEQRVLNVFNNRFVPYFARNVLNMEGSSSLFDKIVKDVLTRTASKETKYVQIDFKLPKGKLKTSGKANSKYSDKSKGSVKKVRHRAGKVKSAAGQSKNVLPDIRQFIGVLNSRINTQVAKNMGSPRLNYRTGRFAESVRITDISKTTQGFPSIGYTYMREPYEVFEFPGTGNPLAQQGQRDPRSLIELSIREIMAQYAIGRFYTRRL
jgi:hypothetical protein